MTEPLLKTRLQCEVRLPDVRRPASVIGKIRFVSVMYEQRDGQRVQGAWIQSYSTESRCCLAHFRRVVVVGRRMPHFLLNNDSILGDIVLASNVIPGGELIDQNNNSLKVVVITDDSSIAHFSSDAAAPDDLLKLDEKYAKFDLNDCDLMDADDCQLVEKCHGSVTSIDSFVCGHFLWIVFVFRFNSCFSYFSFFHFFHFLVVFQKLCFTLNSSTFVSALELAFCQPLFVSICSFSVSFFKE